MSNESNGSEAGSERDDGEVRVEGSREDVVEVGVRRSKSQGSRAGFAVT